MNIHSTQQNDGEWLCVVTGGLCHPVSIWEMQPPCHDCGFVRVTCDMTEVSSDDKYDVSVTLTTAIMARPSAMSVDSCHNERVTPLLALSRRDENNKKSPVSQSRSRMSRVSWLPEAPCQTKLDCVDPGQPGDRG